MLPYRLLTFPASSENPKTCNRHMLQEDPLSAFESFKVVVLSLSPWYTRMKCDLLSVDLGRHEPGYRCMLHSVALHQYVALLTLYR